MALFLNKIPRKAGAIHNLYYLLWRINVSNLSQKYNKIIKKTWLRLGFDPYVGDIIPDFRLSAIYEDPDDNMFLECAIEAKAEIIISGDDHLLGLK
ncbi:putative toxin-antitoxin system toxin component, PIN family [Desulfotruncus arcticus]|uniref:putative toxin-antitoxin system toxin component, PIN family n=1 Tax=Desulfotruncus arcticus TaxID=341036 RepID=UPI000DF159F5|nr:putative toxin-antitoxin system toxin component, PIN family [Desulfotruncus arcticus]